MREGDAQQRGAEDGERIDFDALREQILEAIRAGDEAALRDLARLAIAAFGRRGEGSGVLGVDVQRIRRALGLKSEPSRPGQGRGRAAGAAAHARPDPPLRGPPAARARTRADRAHAGAAAVRARSTSSTARSRAAPRRTSPPSTAWSCSSSAGSPPRATRRAATPATPTSTCARTMRASLRDRRRPGRPEVQAQAPAPPRALRALRRLDARHSRVRLLPERPARAARQLPQACARSSSSSASPRSPTSSSASAPSRRSTTRSPRTPASPTSPATPTTAASGASSCSSVEDDLHPRATVIVLGDARTNGRDPRADIFARIAEKAGRTFWLNPEPQALLELRRQRDQRLQAVLRGLRVLDDAPARGLRQGAHAPDGHLAGSGAGWSLVYCASASPSFLVL